MLYLAMTKIVMYVSILFISDYLSTFGAKKVILIQQKTFFWHTLTRSELILTIKRSHYNRLLLVRTIGFSLNKKKCYLVILKNLHVFKSLHIHKITFIKTFFRKYVFNCTSHNLIVN